MKLFKRTCITLLILIALLWILLFLWVYYPLNNVVTTPVEKEQTELLLKKANISVPEEFLEQKAKALKGADVTYLAEDKEDFAKTVLGDDVFQESENSFVCGDKKMLFSGKTVLIEGKDEDIEKITKDTAASIALAVLDKLKLSNIEMSNTIYEKEDGILVVFVPLFDGKIIYDAKIKILISPDSSFKIEAVPISISKSGERLLPCSPYSAISEIALMDTANGVQIIGMSLGYMLSNNKLICVWEISTDDENVYYVK